MKKIEEIKLAYLSGVLDGDGSFSIIKRTSCMASENRRIPRYRPCLQMYNLSKDMTIALRDNLGGNIGIRHKQQEDWQDQSYWYCVGIKSCEIALETYAIFSSEKGNGSEFVEVCEKRY